MLRDLVLDLRLAVRGFSRNPGFCMVVVMTLALGIGATTAIFSVVNGVLIKPLAYPEPDALVGVWHSAFVRGATVNDVSVSPRMYATYLDNNQTFLDFGVWSTGQATLTGMGDPEQVGTLVVTQGILPALGVQPALGHWFTQADDMPGTPETAILTHGFWERRFSRDRSVIGRTIAVDSRPHIVIGVMPQTFHFLNSDAEMILPQRFNRSQLASDFSYSGIARLKPGMTLAQASADIARMLPIWNATDPVNGGLLTAIRLNPALRPLKQDVVGDVGPVLWVLMGTIAMVLLIACANVANLLLVRADERQQELAIRASLGAGWSRIAQELLIESVTLGVLGGGLGLGFAYGGLQLLAVIGPANLPRLTEISIDPLVMVFALALSLLSGLLFGLIPVVKYAGPKIAGTLQSGGRALSPSRERHRSQNMLVVLQVALALVLLVASGLMIRSFQALRNVQPGFAAPEQIQTARITIPEAQVAEPEAVTRMQNEILAKITAIPGVTSAAFMNALPMVSDFQSNNTVFVEDMPLAEGQAAPLRRIKFVSPNLFQTLRTPLIAGRDFTWADIDNDRDVAVISENLARETWGTPSAALGKRIRSGGTANPWREIVGVVGDIYDNGVHQQAAPIVYAPASLSFGRTPERIRRSVVFIIRSTRAGTGSFLTQIREAVWAVNANIPLAQVRTLGEIYDQSMARTSLTLMMLAIAGGMALLLGVIGIYGVISYAVSQRNREIGIRLALGAQRGELKRMFVRHALVLASIGVAIGLGVAAGLTRLMSSLLFGISPFDPATYLGGALILAMAAVLASYLPARRASAVDPVDALKAE